MTDPINPDHYKRLPAEAIEIIEAAIANAPDNISALNHGQQLKYDLRLFEKGKTLREYLIDQEKHCWYADRLRDHLRKLVEQEDQREKQKAADLQSLKDHPFGKPKWKPKIGDWVKINKPKDSDLTSALWFEVNDYYEGDVIQVEEIEDGAVVLDNLAFVFDWLEPAEAPKTTTETTLNSDKIPEGYRKLGNSMSEPRQLGDLRWSVAEKRYVSISGDELGYANSDNWAACRKITGEVTGGATGEVKPPDGWRWLEVGAVFFKGDTQDTVTPIPEHWIGTVCEVKHLALRRNKFKVGDKVVWVTDNTVWTVQAIKKAGSVFSYEISSENLGCMLTVAKRLAPYIEDAK